jgi:hypothetical protein
VSERAWDKKKLMIRTWGNTFWFSNTFV